MKDKNKTKRQLITELERLRRENSELKTYKDVINNLDIGVSLVSPNMEILAFNNQMEEWFPNVDISRMLPSILLLINIVLLLIESN